jgi:hypothetical protein
LNSPERTRSDDVSRFLSNSSTPADLSDKAPEVRTLLSASKVIKKSPPPPRTGRTTYVNPIYAMQAGEALPVPAWSVGLTYKAVDARIQGSLSWARKRYGMDFTTRREDGVLMIYCTKGRELEA